MPILRNQKAQSSKTQIGKDLKTIGTRTFRRISHSYIESLAMARERELESKIPISTAPAVDPAMIERRALGLSFGFSGVLACCIVAIVKKCVVV